MDYIVNADLIHLDQSVINIEPTLLMPVLFHGGVYCTVIKHAYRLDTREAFMYNNRRRI
jgi:hypothetical protein